MKNMDYMVDMQDWYHPEGCQSMTHREEWLKANLAGDRWYYDFNVGCYNVWFKDADDAKVFVAANKSEKPPTSGGRMSHQEFFAGEAEDEYRGDDFH
jgi:hypothetical protein